MKKLRISPEYGCYPVWVLSETDRITEDVAPDSLPISSELALRISTWDSSFQQTLDHQYPPDSKFSSEVLFHAFQKEGTEIIESLNQQLKGLFEVEYRPVSEELSGVTRKS